jgi:hypothetical protein
MKIDTGITTPSPLPNAPAGIYFIDTVLLPPQVVTAEPGVFSVTDGVGVVLTAYGLGDDETLEIEKILYVSGSAGGSGSCGCPIQTGSVPASVNSTPLCIDGVPWVLDKCNAIRIITVPGRYRVNDELQLTNSNVIVTITQMEKATPPTYLTFGGT